MTAAFATQTTLPESPKSQMLTTALLTSCLENTDVATYADLSRTVNQINLLLPVVFSR